MSISRSTSGQDMNVGCMEGSGADLTLYNEEIIKERMEIPGVGFFAVAKDTEGNRFGLMQATGWEGK